MFQHRRVRVAALAIATAVAVPAVSLIATTSAQAGDPFTEGRVIAKTLPSRTHPTNYATRIATFKKDAHLRIICKVKTVSIDGNRHWYLVKDKGFVPARYVANIGDAPRTCGGPWEQGRVTKKPSMNLRKGPTNASKLAGTAKYKQRVDIICKVDGPKVGGNKLWYQLVDGRWASARYIENAYGVPSYCDK